ncbi:F-box/kelch-repeat protein isoform X1 [Capsicum galapagoense]
MFDAPIIFYMLNIRGGILLWKILTTLMEPEREETILRFRRRSKRRKPRNHTQIPSTSSNDSALVVPTLPQEVITAILVRLPVKYLLQFKCVSKHWYALISSNHFVKTHLSFSANDFTRRRLLLETEKRRLIKRSHRHCSVSSLFYESVTEAFDLDYPINDPKRVVAIEGSVDGLICYSIGYDLVLWNPSTRKFKQLPDLMLMPQQTYNYRFNYGFGYDEALDDYKVLAIFDENCKCHVNAYNLKIKIYNLKSDSWRTLDDIQSEMIYYGSGKLLNGKLHWVTTVVYGGWGVMSIDLVDEKCRKVEHPCYGVENYFLTLGVLGSDLSVLCSHKRTDVWVMKEYGVKESWTKLYTIECPYHVLSPPLCTSFEGEILHVFALTLTICNPEDGLMRYPEVTNIDVYVDADAELYIESLVCPVLQNEPMTQH